MGKYFEYGAEETDYLSKKDKRMAAAIERIGHVSIETDDDLFAAVVRHIIGQQISGSARETICGRVTDLLGEIRPETILSVGVEDLQKCGTSFRKIEYIMDFSERVSRGDFDIEKIKDMTDVEAVEALSSLRGIGAWTAEMLLLFNLNRQDIFSFGDLGIHRGLRMLYRHRKIDRELFEKYRRRFSPYGSVASLYLWQVAGGALPELSDPAPKKKMNNHIRNKIK